MRVYIAGPYTKGDPVWNTKAAILAGEMVVEVGHTPYIPHLNLLWHFATPHSPEFWYNYDLEWLILCDCLIRLKGESPGANREVAYAKERGIPVYTMSEFYDIIKA